MLVPSGQEPLQLLSFFKGTMVVHSSPYSSPHPSPLLSSPHRGTSSPGHQTTRLYQVSGSSLEHIKAMEVKLHDIIVQLCDIVSCMTRSRPAARLYARPTATSCHLLLFCSPGVGTSHPRRLGLGHSTWLRSVECSSKDTI